MPEIKILNEISAADNTEQVERLSKSSNFDIQLDIADKRLESAFNEARDAESGFYTTYRDRINKTPSEFSQNGHWKGIRGESCFIPSSDTEKGLHIMEILKANGLYGIEYRNGEPDFSECAECTVEIDNMTAARDINFPQADIKCAQKWSAESHGGKSDWTRLDVEEWRKEKLYSWHERCDKKTMDLIPRDINTFFGHLGGCAECRVRDNKGGNFDE